MEELHKKMDTNCKKNRSGVLIINIPSSAFRHEPPPLHEYKMNSNN